MPRLHVLTSDEVLDRADLGARMAAAAAAGPAVALHARTRLGGSRQAELTRRLVALAAPAEASVFVNGRPELALAFAAQGLQLAADDLPVPEARRVLGPGWRGWIGRSVHGMAEARAAHEEGADYLMVGNVYPTASHPDRRAAGLALVSETATLEIPVIAVGGITPERVAAARAAGAWGVAVLSAIWEADDPARTALDLLGPWLEE